MEAGQALAAKLPGLDDVVPVSEGLQSQTAVVAAKFREATEDRGGGDLFESSDFELQGSLSKAGEE